MKTDIENKSLKELSTIGALSSIVFLVTLLEIIDNAAILASAQEDTNTIEVTILSDASRLTDTAYQPNSVNIEVGDTVVWTNDDSAPHTL